MQKRSKLALAVLSLLTATLAFGLTSAYAHRGDGPRGGGPYGAGASELVAAAAKQLDVSTARLRSAIVTAAIARIDEAVEDAEVEAEDADELKDEARENLRFAIKVSRTGAVASNLDITAARLNSAFRAARRALITARIDEAVEDGDLDAEEAAELKEELAEARLPATSPSASASVTDAAAALAATRRGAIRRSAGGPHAAALLSRPR